MIHFSDERHSGESDCDTDDGDDDDDDLSDLEGAAPTTKHQGRGPRMIAYIWALPTA